MQVSLQVSSFGNEFFDFSGKMKCKPLTEVMLSKKRSIKGNVVLFL